MNSVNLSLQYGEAYNHIDSYEFIAQELLQYGSFIINFVDKKDNYIPILISYPRALFVKERYIYLSINNQSIIQIALNIDDIKPNILPKEIQNMVSYQELSEFIQGIRDSLRKV
jgi:hypothetical protein